MAGGKTDLEIQIAERFGANLAKQRKAAGLHQLQLAERARLGREQINAFECGRNLPRFENFVKLVGALGVSPEALMDGISWKPPVTTGGEMDVS